LKKRIVAVASDRGGWNAVDPSLRLALDAGWSVHACLDGASAKQHAQGALPIDARTFVIPPPSDAHGFGPLRGEYDLLVVAASQSEQGTETACNAVRGLNPIPSVAVQDMYGSLAPTLRGINPIAFDRICVHDAFAGALLEEAGLASAASLRLTGGPQFDRVIGMRRDWDALRAGLRHSVSLRSEDFVVLIVGDTEGTVDLLELLELGLSRSGRADAKVILRAHPRATAEEREKGEAYMRTTSLRFVDVPADLRLSSDDFLPASDIVMSGFSTTNYIGLLCQMPGVVYVGTPVFRDSHMREKGMAVPPEASNGAAWYARTSEDLGRVIRDVTELFRNQVASPELSAICAKQRQLAETADGQAAQRVWNEMRSLF